MPWQKAPPKPEEHISSMLAFRLTASLEDLGAASACCEPPGHEQLLGRRTVLPARPATSKSSSPHLHVGEQRLLASLHVGMVQDHPGGPAPILKVRGFAASPSVPGLFRGCVAWDATASQPGHGASTQASFPQQPQGQAMQSAHPNLGHRMAQNIERYLEMSSERLWRRSSSPAPPALWQLCE